MNKNMRKIEKICLLGIIFISIFFAGCSLSEEAAVNSVIKSDNSTNIDSKGNYYNGKVKWSSNTITYRFTTNMGYTKNSLTYTNATIRNLCREAFQEWRSGSLNILTFTEVAATANANIDIRLVNNNGAPGVATTTFNSTYIVKSVIDLNSPAYSTNDIRSIFIHEIGHSLGLKHEHQRQDAPNHFGQAIDGTPYGAYDSDSIMDYNSSYNNRLSNGDRAAIRNLYGPLSSLNLYTIIKNGTGTNSTEIHGLKGRTGYMDFFLHKGTPLGETGDNWVFEIGDHNKDGYKDIYAIMKSATGTKSTEIHILSGKTNYQSWLLHTGTPLGETGSNYDFALGDYNRDGYLDLYAIKKSSTGTKSTEIHVLNGKNNFQSWLLHTGTVLVETGSNYVFEVGDYNKDGYQDVYAIKKSSTGTKSTEIHVLNGKNKYQSWLLHTGTVQVETGSNYEFELGDYNNDGYQDVYAIKKSLTGTHSTEVHVLNGKSNFQNWLLHTGTMLGETGSNFVFLVD